MVGKADEKSVDDRRDEGLLRMLKMRPKSNRELKVGRLRNPRHHPQESKSAKKQAD
jgi:hypothetical protein